MDTHSNLLTAYRKWRKGVLQFTLLELLIVVAVLAVLLALILPKILRSGGEQRCFNAMRELRDYVQNLQLRLADTGVTVDPDAERQNLEAKMRKVDENCGGSEPVTNNTDLKTDFERMYGIIRDTTNAREEGSEERGLWEALRLSAARFAGRYFPGFAE